MLQSTLFEIHDINFPFYDFSFISWNALITFISSQMRLTFLNLNCHIIYSRWLLLDALFLDSVKSTLNANYHEKYAFYIFGTRNKIFKYRFLNIQCSTIIFLYQFTNQTFYNKFDFLYNFLFQLRNKWLRFLWIIQLQKQN